MNPLSRTLLLGTVLAAGCPAPSVTGSDTGDSAGNDTADTGNDTADTGSDTADTGNDTADTGSDTGDSGDTGTLADPDLATLGDWLDTTEAWTGDTSCVGETWAAPEAVCQTDLSLSGSLVNFQTGNGVSLADWSMWFADAPVGAADASGTSSRSGEYSTTARSCTPVTVAAATSSGGGYLPTWSPHTIWPYANLGAGVADITVAEASTIDLVANLLGAEWHDATTGVIAGKVLGCDGEPLGGVQVVVVDAEGHAPTGAQAWYFDGTSFPASRARQPTVNASNGLFVILNVPDGDWRVFVYGWDGSTYTPLGASPLTIAAGSASLLTVYTGHTDGVSYPDICFAPCDEIN